MIIPLTEFSRRLLMQGYVADIRAWKADDIAETVVFAVKDPARDVDDCSFYSITKAGLLADNPAIHLFYIGTTTMGKDGWPMIIVFNDGLVLVLSTETPLPGQSGTFSNLYVVRLNYRVSAELSGGAPGSADLQSRAAINKIITALKAGNAALPPLL